MLQENQKTVLVLEDDVTFSPTFTKMLYHVLREARMFTPSWDFMWVAINISYMSIDPSLLWFYITYIVITYAAI